jgi:hypothetical protein
LALDPAKTGNEFDMNLIVNLLIISTLILSSPLLAEPSVTKGQFPPEKIQQKVRPLLKDVRAAQLAKDEKLITEITNKIIQHLGPWAANPSQVPSYHTPISAETPSEQEVLAMWQKISPRIKKNALWIAVPDGNPDAMTGGLRQAARPIISNAAMHAFKNNKQFDNLEFVIAGADYLLKLQRSNGLFPSPDLRGDDQTYTSFNKRALRKNPDALVEGWFVDDFRGELQLDHAVSGIAMLKAYQLTNDQRYLQSAVAAADWAISKDLDTNWSYNAYSAWLLAETYQHTNKPIYLFHGIEKLRLGVLPGLLDSGRWFDPVNARLLYHSANVRGMIAVYKNLPEENPLRLTLQQKIVSALNNASQQIINHGASSTTTSTEMLVEALRELGDNDTWRKALNININAAIDASKGKGESAIGVFLPSYIEFAFAKK